MSAGDESTPASRRELATPSRSGGRWRIAAVAWDIETESERLPGDLDRLLDAA